MVAINLNLDTRKAKKDGTFPIKLFLRHKTKMAYLNANYSIKEEYWDNGRIKRGCPSIENIRFANNKLAMMLKQAEKGV
ncbi:hypothetical protein BZG01_14290 [Labilibaculum manganireducens]|uniref:Uncharacterized protein n=1 Tax=Labilibaculum manganireducens TaxID=1940525 RepID=A0A2N3I2N0_9BACT|nr:Arm DNA-binding domain-containing protein [Labilibaculum manganireducens]PKQ64556.1 hypothetical protein BZG01_14290 [Labilibaculum manganireducens]